MDPNSISFDSIFQAPHTGDLAAQSPARITKIRPLPTELRHQILKYMMEMIKEPGVILDLYEMPRGNRFPNQKIRFLRPKSQENFPWLHYENNSPSHALDLIDAFEDWHLQRSFYKRRTLGLLGASKECRDFYSSYFPIVLPCGRNGHGQLRIAKDEVLHILNFNTTFNSHHFYQAIGNSYLVDKWWSQLERISFVPGHLTAKFLEELVFFIARMDSLKEVEVFLPSGYFVRAKTAWRQYVIGDAVKRHNRRFRLEYQMPKITFREGQQVCGGLDFYI